MTWKNTKPAKKSKPVKPEKNLDWGEVVEYSNWCNIDQLHGTTLSAGELLEIEWPDKTTEYTSVVTEESSYQISDMGTPYQVPVCKAYGVLKYHGAEIRVRLLGLRARRLG